MQLKMGHDTFSFGIRILDCLASSALLDCNPLSLIFSLYINFDNHSYYFAIFIAVSMGKTHTSLGIAKE